MGRQPFGLASPAAWLRDAGADVVCLDLSKERLREAAVHDSELVAFFLPMHTATRLALPIIDRVRAINPQAALVAYGLYAPLNADLLRERGVTHILGGEFEADLAGLVTHTSERQLGRAANPPLARLDFKVPDRAGLLPLSRYATLQMIDGRRTVGYTEASRGCKHRCRHCPIVPVYDGRFRIVAPDVVLADVRAQVAAGARHITFGDPDFFNGVKHADAVVRGFARQFPGVTYDVTIKVEHLLKHAALLPLLRDTGCAFVTSAVESVDDAVLEKLEKGHTRAGFEQMVALFRESGLALTPTFVAFTPWTTLDGYLDLLHAIDRLDLVDNVAPIQLAIRLLVPQGSRMLELADVRAVTGAFDAGSLTYPWTHADAAVDALQAELTHLVGGRLSASRRDLFARIWDIAHARAGVDPPKRQDPGIVPRTAIPYLNEPWYC
jgi:radical SAM superfamily enzyme YgiQ (UPF0313 family)